MTDHLAAPIRQALTDVGAVPISGSSGRWSNWLPVEGGQLLVTVHHGRIYGSVAVDRIRAGDLPKESTRAWAAEHLDPFALRALGLREPGTFGYLVTGGAYTWLSPVLVSDIPELIRLWLPWEIEQQVTALPAMKAAWRG